MWRNSALYSYYNYILYACSCTTCTSSASPSPLPLTCLCPWDYPSAYVGIYRIVRQWSGSWVGVSAAIVLFQFPRGILVTMIYFLIIILPRWISWFADFTSFNLMSSSSILGCHSRPSFICASCSFFCSCCSMRILLVLLPLSFSLFLSYVVLHADL